MHDSARTGPRRDDFVALSWLTSRRVWVATLVVAVPFLALTAGVGALLYGAAPLGLLTWLVTSPLGILTSFLVARAYGLGLVQRHRDDAVRSGRYGPGRPVTTLSIVTVASFSVVGLVAAAVAAPMLYDTDGIAHWVATGVAAVVLPISYPLLVHLLSERVSADRYRRGYRTLPAVWTFCWTLPLVLVAWQLLVLGGRPLALALPAWTASYGVPARYAGSVVPLGLWELGYVAIATPTVLAFWYPVRRWTERLMRTVLG